MKPKISKIRLGQLLQFVFHLIDLNGGAMNRSEVKKKMEKSIQLTKAEKSETKSGLPTWWVRVDRAIIGSFKNGWLKHNENRGSWVLTQEGRNYLGLTPEGYMRMHDAEYKKWKQSQGENKAKKPA